MGWDRIRPERVGKGLEHIAKALRLNPFPASWYYLALGPAQYAAGEYEPPSRHCAGTRPIGRAPAVSWQQALPNSAGSTRRAGRPNSSSSPTPIFNPPLGDDRTLPRHRDACAFCRGLPQGRPSLTRHVIEPRNDHDNHALQTAIFDAADITSRGAGPPNIWRPPSSTSVKHQRTTPSRSSRNSPTSWPWPVAIICVSSSVNS
ncbi:hypothetical protein M2308_004266 [Rhizobium leguminosarum]|nr:hypothetical protein [Rhizobium leguminosarum]